MRPLTPVTPAVRSSTMRASHRHQLSHRVLFWLQSGVGFAIPVNYAINIANQIIDGENPVHPYLGVSLVSVNAYNARTNELAVDSGAYVAEVTADGPAAQAGIQKGDIVTAVDGEGIASADGLIIALREHEVGDEVTLTVVRGKDETEVEVNVSGSAPGPTGGAGGQRPTAPAPERASAARSSSLSRGVHGRRAALTPCPTYLGIGANCNISAGAEEAPAFSLPDGFQGVGVNRSAYLLEGGELEVAVATFDEVEQHAADTEL